MRTITISPGEEIRIVCEGAANNNAMGNNKGNNKPNNKPKNGNNNRRANLNYNNSNANNMNYPNNGNNDAENNAANDEELEDINEVETNSAGTNENRLNGGKRGRKTRKAKKARKGTQKGGKKRGPNGYMKFAAEMRPKILKENPELKSNVVSVARKIGEAWRKMPEAERKKY